ncbi:hypothetical protein F5148DRAFT_1152412 [Russula earlei]|uniref:Uncharacterized protein n=1 Tax=Russula earlei TaxID=71964 RepID=A0ACC0TXV7_9AGAM|nr:hypothetical protein F5148DRAFT_1152412 [Russula earlei]
MVPVPSYLCAQRAGSLPFSHATRFFLILSPSSSHHPRAAQCMVITMSMPPTAAAHQEKPARGDNVELVTAREHVRVFLKTLNSRPSHSETCPETRKIEWMGPERSEKPSGHAGDYGFVQSDPLGHIQRREQEGHSLYSKYVFIGRRGAKRQERQGYERKSKSVEGHIAIGDGKLLRMWSRDVREVMRGQTGGDRMHDGDNDVPV